MAMALTIPTLFLLFLSSKFPCSSAQTWIKSGYWFSGSKFPVTDINSPLFTHLICTFAGLNPSTYQLSISSSDALSFSTFTPTVKQKNPTVTTLISIGGGSTNSSTFSSMVSQSGFRKSFIESSMKTARSYGFDGLDFCWFSISRLNASSEMANMATLFDEWRLAIESESGNSSGSQLILTMAVWFSPYLDNASFPIESIKKNLNWVHVMAFDYCRPTSWNYTAAFAALYHPGSQWSTEYGINAWIDGGLSANKLVLGLPFYGYAWTLVNPNDSEIGAPAKGTAITDDGWMRYKYLKAYMQRSGAVSEYNAAYVVNYCVIGSSWIAYDDVEVVKDKVAYAKKRNLLGYIVSQVEDDDENWVLTQAAQEDEKNPGNKRHFLLILLPTATIVTLVLVYATWYLRKRARRNKGRMGEGKESQSLFKTTMASAGAPGSTHLKMLFTIISFLLFLPPLTSSSKAQTWIKAGYWYFGGEFPISDIDSTLFTHLTFAFAFINNSTYELLIAPSVEPYMFTFTDIVRQKNPSIVTLLSIWIGDSNLSTFFSMATQPSHRSSFIESSIQRARLYGFHGLELCYVKPDTSTTKMKNMGILFDDWRTAVDRESKNSTRSPLVLTLASQYLPSKNSTSYPMESIRRNFDWVHIVSYFYHLPTMENFTGAHSALYDPSSNVSTDYGIKEWISRGLPAKKMVLGLPYHGYAWTLLDPSANEIGSPATGPAVTVDGSMFYKFIKSYMRCDGEKVVYNSTYVTNYCINGSVWIGYDDVEAIRTKVSYAREKGLLGYKVWHVANDDSWVLSKTAGKTLKPHHIADPN